MKLSDIVTEEAILTDLNVDSRNAAVEALIDALIECGAMKKTQRESFIKQIIDREEKGSTGFGHGVAVPHIKETDVKNMALAIGISSDGIDFNALDKQPVYTVFLLLSPKDRPEDHLDAMEAIFGNLSQETFRRFLRQATTRDDVLTLLNEADARAAVR